MLIGIDPLLTPELLMHLSAMGHGEWVAVVDANFTADFLAKGRPVAFMHVCHAAPAHRTPAQDAVVALAVQAGCAADRVEPVERFAFYERIKAASLIVQSGESTAYGNALFCKGVILG